MMDFGAGSMDKARSDLGLIADTRGLDKLRKLGNGTNKEKAQALYMAAQQFEQMLMQYWVDGMRATNESLNPDSPLHSKYSGFFDDMLAQQQVGAMVNGNNMPGSINKSSISYLITKQFAASFGDEGKALLAALEGKDFDPALEAQGIKPGEYGAINEVSKQNFMQLGKEKIVPSIAINKAQDDKDITPAQLYASAHTKANATIGKLKSLYASLPPQSQMRDFASPEEFVDKMMPYALKAVEGLSMNPLVLVAQAALETGWGKHVPEGNNYYGIKANASWKGATQDLNSPEFENGRMVTRNSRFRAYDSVLDSMKDYVALITGNKRYEKAASQSYNPDTYFEEIQKAGYATDPNYAAKLKNIARQIAFMAYK